MKMKFCLFNNILTVPVACFLIAPFPGLCLLVLFFLHVQILFLLEPLSSVTSFIEKICNIGSDVRTIAFYNLQLISMSRMNH